MVLPGSERTLVSAPRSTTPRKGATPMDAPTNATTPQDQPEPRSPFRPNRLTSGIVAGGAAFAMVLAGLGIASAQTEGSTPTPTDPPAATAPADPAAPGKPGGHGGRHRHPIANPARVASVIGIT